MDTYELPDLDKVKPRKSLRDEDDIPSLPDLDEEAPAPSGKDAPGLDELYASRPKKSTGGGVGDFLKGAAYGVKESLMPFGIEQGEQREATDTTAGAVGSLLGNLGASIGVGAVITGVTGGTAAPVAAAKSANALRTTLTGLWALYQGVGRERVRANESGEEFEPLGMGKSTLRTLLATGLELNPLTKAESKIAAALRVGAQAGGEAAYEKLHGGTDAGALFAGALGLAGAVPTIAWGARKRVPEEAKEVLLDSAEKATRTGTDELFTKAEDKLKTKNLSLPEVPDDLFKRYAVGDVDGRLTLPELDKEYTDLAKRLSIPDAEREAAAKLGKKIPNKLEDKWVSWQGRQAMDEAISELNGVRLAKLRNEKPVRGAFERFALPAFYVSRIIDDKTGFNTAGLVSKVSESNAVYNTVAARFIKPFSELKDRADAIGLKGRDISALIEGTDGAVSKNWAGNKEAEEIVRGIKTQMGELLKYLRSLGYNIEERAHYLPEKTMKAPQMAAVLDQAIASFSGDFSAARRAASEGIKGPETDLIKSIDFVANRVGLKKPESAKDWAEVRSALLSSERRFTSKDLPGSIKELNAAFGRDAGIPGLVREQDAWKRISSYVTSNLRAAHMDDAIKQGENVIVALDKVGMKDSADFFRRYLSDQLGGAQGLNAAIKAVATKMETEGAKQSMAKLGIPEGANFMSTAPELANWLSGQIFVSKLALNAPGLLRNSSQFIFTTVPELGGKYGSEKALGAVTRMMKNRNWQSIYSTLEEKGLMAQHGRLDTSSFGEAFTPKRFIDKVNEGGLRVGGKELPGLFSMYQGTDKFNRVVTWEMARDVAHDVLANKKDALKFIDGLDTGTKQAVRKILSIPEKSGDDLTEKFSLLHDELGRYLINKTQFDYSKANKAEWARKAGPYFSMFSTWPSMIGGDIYYNLTKKDWKRGANQLLWKYMPYYGLTMIAAHQINQMEDSPLKTAAKYLAGDPKEYSPLTSVIPGQGRDGVRGGILQSPGLTTLRAGGQALINSLPSVDEEGKVRGPSIQPIAKFALKDVVPTYLPLVAPIWNEANRVERVRSGKTLSTQVLESLDLDKDKRK